MIDGEIKFVGFFQEKLNLIQQRVEQFIDRNIERFASKIFQIRIGGMSACFLSEGFTNHQCFPDGIPISKMSSASYACCIDQGNDPRFTRNSFAKITVDFRVFFHDLILISKLNPKYAIPNLFWFETDFNSDLDFFFGNF